MTEEPVVMKGVRLIFRNFRGEKSKFNQEGRRNFAVLLPDDVAKDMILDGWNVKYLKPRDEEEEENPQAYLQVTMRYDVGRPPRVVVITGNGTKRRDIDEDEVGSLDWAEMNNVDLIVRPFNWDVNGKQGTSAYLKSLWVTIEEDELEEKYSGLEVR